MAKIDKILGSISPAYGLISGQGAFSKLRNVSPAFLAIDAMKEKKKGKDGTTTTDTEEVAMRRGGKAKKYAAGGSTASKRADGCATKGKTKGRFV